MKYIKKWILLFFIGIVILQNSCTTKSELRFQLLSKEIKKSNYISAIEKIHKKNKLYGKINRLLYHMDIGTLYHYAGLFDSSNHYLENAVQLYDDLFTKSITNEAIAFLTNDNIRPYRSKPYEMLFLHQLMMMNRLSQNDFDAALVETRRSQLLIDQWEKKDRKNNKYTSDGFFHYMSALSYNQINEPDNAAISLYKSVNAYQESSFPVPNHVKNMAYYTFLKQERDDDIKSLHLEPTVSEDKVVGLQGRESEIIVVGYAGRGPVLGEKVWWGTWVKDGLLILHYRTSNGQQETVTLPAPSLPHSADSGKTESGTTFHIKFAMPEIKVFPSETGYFTVKSPSITQPLKSIVMNDMDKLCEKYLEDSRAKTILRTAIRVVARTIATQRVKEKMETENGALNLLLNFGTDLLADQLEKADTRSLFLIPKTIQIARIPMKPGVHSVEILTHNTSGKIIDSKLVNGIQIKEGEKKFLFYSSLY